jgi:hypothetical protein
MSQSANKQAYILVDPSIDCHQRLRWETPPEPSAPPPLVIHRPRFFVPLIRRPAERIIYGYGDASQSGAAGHWNTDYNGFMWVVPMGGRQPPTDSLSRWMELSSLHEMAGDHNRWRVGGVVDLTDEQRLLRIQTDALVQDVVVEDLGEIEYVD